ncbi:MAG: biotin--[acetyl-CoA-carboxylase] ligase [Bacteroidetes bacterium]|nr:MAG: biotin--[acetyl-CoA-carboxylase] ligase [Bacteroidota bacterium]
MDINAFTSMLDFNVIWLNEVESTNTVAREMINNGEAKEGLMIVANHQTHGRGQQDNRWESESGQNILCSLVLEPLFLNVSQQVWLNMAICLAVYDALAFYAKEVRIKWPNDVYISDKKVAGLLIENTVQGQQIKHTIAGVGININQSKFADERASSLSKLTNDWFDRNDVLQQILNYIKTRYNQLRLHQFDKINQDYHQVLYGKGEIKKYVADGQVFEGIITGVNEQGNLIVNVNGTNSVYMVKQISML